MFRLFWDILRLTGGWKTSEKQLKTEYKSFKQSKKNHRKAVKFFAENSRLAVFLHKGNVYKHSSILCLILNWMWTSYRWYEPCIVYYIWTLSVTTTTIIFKETFSKDSIGRVQMHNQTKCKHTRTSEDTDTQKCTRSTSKVRVGTMAVQWTNKWFKYQREQTIATQQLVLRLRIYFLLGTCAMCNVHNTNKMHSNPEK